MDKANPAVPIMLDKERHLLLDLNGMIAFQEESEVNLLDGNASKVLTKDMTPKILRAFFWACLIHEDEELTLKQAGAFIHMVNLEVIVEKLEAAWGAAMPEGGKDDIPLARKPRSKPRHG